MVLPKKYAVLWNFNDLLIWLESACFEGAFSLFFPSELATLEERRLQSWIPGLKARTFGATWINQRIFEVCVQGQQLASFGLQSDEKEACHQNVQCQKSPKEDSTF
ncbi:uncharacterized protein [Ambystoma mexicanum]|uniref:uncharacterized protein isoform X3 n=1 Tax=Ambystoma mexicanum TaxID=8296 RepID=UPI0037E9916D